MANKLLVSFEIHWDDSDTYNRLYKATQEAIKEGLSGSQWWAETTAFYVVDSQENSQQFASRVANSARLRKEKDRLLVINMNAEGGAAWGKFEDHTIFSLLPFVKKL